MSVTTPPRRSEIEKGRDLERRVADLEALIEEARRRARRRRMRRGGAALLLLAAGVVAFIGFGGDDDGGGGTAAAAHAPQGSTASAQSPPLGALPAGTGFVESFVFDPRNPQVVYVMTNAGLTGPHVFKSTDGGSHWHATATSGSGWEGANEALTVDPRHPATIYAGTSAAVYKTADGGRTWRPSLLGLFVPPRDSPYHRRSKGWLIALAVDPGNANVVYAGSDRVSKSRDGGRSWKTVFPLHPTPYRESVSALAIAPTQPEAIYAISGDSASGLTSIYKSTDAGTTWHATTGVRGLNALGFDTALAVDPRHPTTVYAAIGAHVLKTTNAGETWQPIADGLPLSTTRGPCHCLSLGGVTTLAVDPTQTGVVYAALTQRGIYKTTNGGRTWIASYAPLGDMSTVAVDPARPSTIYAADVIEMAVGPRILILRSTNGGRTWATAP